MVDLRLYMIFSTVFPSFQGYGRAMMIRDVKWKDFCFHLQPNLGQLYQKARVGLPFWEIRRGSFLMVDFFLSYTYRRNKSSRILESASIRSTVYGDDGEKPVKHIEQGEQNLWNKLHQAKLNKR